MGNKSNEQTKIKKKIKNENIKEGYRELK